MSDSYSGSSGLTSSILSAVEQGGQTVAGNELGSLFGSTTSSITPQSQSPISSPVLPSSLTGGNSLMIIVVVVIVGLVGFFIFKKL